MNMTKIVARDFDLKKTLDSGQVFHWEKIGNGFVGTIGEMPAFVEQLGDVLGISVASDSSRAPSKHAQDARATVAKYFALDHSLTKICDSFPNDPVMNTAREFCRGLRIIRQPKWECLATFICSPMKQIAHIRQISRKLRERFGEQRRVKLSCKRGQTGVDWVAYTFPTAERIALSCEKELRECALGYRAKNLLATARLVASGEADLEAWAALGDIDLCASLSGLPGVGPKVANCVMLFAYERLRAFPIDVWIKRVLQKNYFPGARKLNAARLQIFTGKYFGEHGGYAQQYLFHHARANRDGVSALPRPSFTAPRPHHPNDKRSRLT